MISTAIFCPSRFAELTIEAIAARAGVGKPTIYRRWSSKARLVMDAFLATTAPELAFPDTGSVLEDIRLQMRQLVNVMNSPRGQVIATLTPRAVATRGKFKFTRS